LLQPRGARTSAKHDSEKGNDQKNTRSLKEGPEGNEDGGGDTFEAGKTHNIPQKNLRRDGQFDNDRFHEHRHNCSCDPA
jgi:hypothetical protein